MVAATAVAAAIDGMKGGAEGHQGTAGDERVVAELAVLDVWLTKVLARTMLVASASTTVSTSYRCPFLIELSHVAAAANDGGDTAAYPNLRDIA